MGGGSHQQVQEGQYQQQGQQQQIQQNPCQTEVLNFSNCIQRNDDLSYCQSFSDMLKTCKQQNNLQWLILKSSNHSFIMSPKAFNIYQEVCYLLINQKKLMFCIISD